MNDKSTPVTNVQTEGDQLKVVILNQYFVPDVASTGHLLFELSETLASGGAEVTVLTCRPSYGPPETWQDCPRNEYTNGVRVKRLWSTRLSKNSIIGRVLNSITFLLPLALLHVLPRRRGEVFLYTTNPPYLGFVGAFVSLLKRHNYVVLLHDSYPELAVWVGKVRKNGVIDRIWRWCNRIMYKRARQTIVLSEAAKRLVCDNYGPEPDRVHVIPNWADPNKLKPKPKTKSRFANQHGLVEPFTVLYSGNLGMYYEFNMLLEGAEQLKDENFRLVFIGAGAQYNTLSNHIEKSKNTNIQLHPYQPQEQFNDALNSCDALIVTIAKGIDGISFPSKLYTSLSVGKPIIAFSPINSELRLIVEQYDVGTWLEIDDTEGFVDCIRNMMSNPEEVQATGIRSRQLLKTKYSIDVANKEYFHVLRKAYDSTR